MDVDLVLYHDGCADGFCSAWIAAHKSSLTGHPTAFRAIKPGDDNIGEITSYLGKHVAVFDVLPSEQALVSLSFAARKLTLRDHHISNRSVFSNLTKTPNIDAHFDMTKSGAGLAWDYFFPGTIMPPIVAHVQDRDLWRFELPGSEAVHAYLTYAVGFSIRGWNDAAALPYDELISRGHIARATAMTFVDVVARNPDVVDLAPDGVALFVNASFLASDVADKVLRDNPEARFACVWRQQNGRMFVSLRGATRGPNLAEIAQTFGGGGHPNAAGFASDHSSYAELSAAVKAAYETANK